MPIFIWLFLIFSRGRFWMCDQKLQETDSIADPVFVVALIPARNEAKTIRRSVLSLLKQKFPGTIKVIVIDDDSSDGTTLAVGKAPDLSVIRSSQPPPGWTGKLWALQKGIGEIEKNFPEASFIILSDADIEHGEGVINQLLLKIQSDNLALVSLMVKLHCKSFWERLLIPPFIFFFQKLYPFSWVNDPMSKVSAAAGGCILVRRDSLEESGGIPAISSRLIDDCSLAKNLKASGPIWLGLSETTKSLRSYNNLSSIWKMVARTAFTQINYSFLNLIGVIICMTATYFSPPVLLVYGVIQDSEFALSTGLGSWMLMMYAYQPTIEYFGISRIWLVTLPFAGFFYTLMTISSAVQHLFGRGGVWKGRYYR